jgi:hypothetical protein
MRKALLLFAALSVLLVFVSGCDPLIQIGGAFFPCWLFCPVLGAFLSFLCRPLFVALGVEDSLWPRALVYPSIAVFTACLTYIIFFR